jgi:RNA polymerase sigma-70 factor (ECF subfamily)
MPVGFDSRPESLALHSALRRLPLMYREPLLLQVLGGFTLEDIAEVLDLPGNTVATRLHRARQKLRMMLEPQGEGIGHELP